jgi:hypothetical protein
MFIVYMMVEHALMADNQSLTHVCKIKSLYLTQNQGDSPLVRMFHPGLTSLQICNLRE